MVYKRYAYKKENGGYLPKKRKMDKFIKENISLKRMRHTRELKLLCIVISCVKLMDKS